MWWWLRQLRGLLQLKRIEVTMSGGWLESSEIEPLLPKARRSSAPAIFLRQLVETAAGRHYNTST
jgi:hypothetical protein